MTLPFTRHLTPALLALLVAGCSCGREPQKNPGTRVNGDQPGSGTGTETETEGNAAPSALPRLLLKAAKTELEVGFAGEVATFTASNGTKVSAPYVSYSNCGGDFKIEGKDRLVAALATSRAAGSQCKVEVTATVAGKSSTAGATFRLVAAGGGGGDPVPPPVVAETVDVKVTDSDTVRLLLRGSVAELLWPAKAFTAPLVIEQLTMGEPLSSAADLAAQCQDFRPDLPRPYAVALGFTVNPVAPQRLIGRLQGRAVTVTGAAESVVVAADVTQLDVPTRSATLELVRLANLQLAASPVLWGEEAGTLRVVSHDDKLMPLLCRMATGTVAQLTFTIRDGSRHLRLQAGLDVRL